MPEPWNQVVVFLQNAWSPFYAGGEWPRASWLPALQRSRSGQRLRILIADPECCHNTTPIVGATPSSKVLPDPEHIRRILAERSPSLVVACGKQAESAVSVEWAGDLLVVPHPAARLLTDELYRDARAWIQRGAGGRVAFRQKRGHVVVEELASPTPSKDEGSQSLLFRTSEGP